MKQNGKIKLKYIDFRDLAFFLLSADRELILNLARELGLANSGSPYYDWSRIELKDVLKALEKKLVVDKDKRKQVKNLLKMMGYIK